MVKIFLRENVNKIFQEIWEIKSLNKKCLELANLARKIRNVGKISVEKIPKKIFEKMLRSEFWQK